MISPTEEAFLDQLEENQNLIHKVCSLYTNNEENHKELFQEITVQLWRTYTNFRGESKFSTWAYRVALNTAMALYRKSVKTSTISFDIEFHNIKSEDYNYEIDEHLKMLYKAIREQLTDIEKALVFMYLEEKDYTEIAGTLGISEVNARVKLSRTKEKLKKILNP